MEAKIRKHSSLNPLNIFRLFVFAGVVYNSGIIYGLITLCIGNLIYDYLFLKLWKLKPFDTLDNQFLEWKGSEAYTGFGIIELETLNLKELQSLLVEKAIRKFSRLRQMKVFKFYNWHWKEVSVEEASKQIIMRKETVKDKLELNELICKQEITKNFQENELQYEFQIYKKSCGEGGFLVIKFDHILSDGVGMMSLVFALSDNFSPSIFPPFKTISFFKKVLSFLMFPLKIYKVATLSNKHMIKRSSPFLDCYSKENTTSKEIGISGPISFKAVRKVAAELKLTFNDFLVSILSNTLKKYCQKKGYYDSDQVCLIVTNSLNGFPKSIDEVKLNNTTSGSGSLIKLVENPLDDYKDIKKTLDSTIKDFPYICAVSTFNYLLQKCLPLLWFKKVYRQTVESTDLIFSNLPGPRESLFYAGSKVLDLFPIINNAWHPMFLACITYGDTFKIMGTSDTNFGISPNEIIKIFEETVQDIISKSIVN